MKYFDYEIFYQTVHIKYIENLNVFVFYIYIKYTSLHRYMTMTLMCILSAY